MTRQRRKSSRSLRPNIVESHGLSDSGDDEDGADDFGDDFDDFEEGAEDDDFDDFEGGFQQPQQSVSPAPPMIQTLPFVRFS